MCGEDSDLLAEAARLVSVRDRVAGFLERPALEIVGLCEIASAAEPLSSGERIKERYVIEQPLGEGSFGFAYAARDLQLAGRRVVVKVLPGTGEASGAHFHRELESLARLDHPGIVGVYDSGQFGDGFFLVTQFVPGPTLRAVLANGPVYPARAIKLIRQLAAAIDCAHAESICHYDLKPENIILREEGTPGERAVIIDFGLAGPQATPEAGSLRYMAPERAVGAGGPSCDLYALGIIAAELLTGISSFSLAVAGMSPAVGLMLSRATAEEPRSRFPAASEFAEALAAALRPSRARWTHYGFAAAILSAVAAILVLIGRI